MLSESGTRYSLTSERSRMRGVASAKTFRKRHVSSSTQRPTTDRASLENGLSPTEEFRMSLAVISLISNSGLMEELLLACFLVRLYRTSAHPDTESRT